MKNNWSHNELLIAFNLYCKTTFSKINANYYEVKRLAPFLGRTPSALAMKLANFARLDPALQARGIKGLSGGSKAELEIWHEFNNNWEDLTFESERILAKLENQPLSTFEYIDDFDPLIVGKEREALIKVRVNQSFFRKAVLASYNSRCCITGVSVPELLVAGHIIPWATDQKNRVNPTNGLCLNALHDKAFDKGLITITTDFKIKVAQKILNKNDDALYFLTRYDGGDLIKPHRFLPSLEFLDYHNQNIFLG